MSESKNLPRRKKRLITKKNRSAWIVSIILILLMALRLVAGIVRPTSGQKATAVAAIPAASPAYSEQDKAQSAVQTFFSLLAEKRYTEAVTYYSGNYDSLAAVYPQDANDKARLLQDVCEHASCFPIHSTTNVQADGADIFNFTVTFAGEDGRLFTQAATDGSQISQFDVSVVKQNGRYLVQNLPIN